MSRTPEKEKLRTRGGGKRKGSQMQNTKAIENEGPGNGKSEATLGSKGEGDRIVLPTPKGTYSQVGSSEPFSAIHPGALTNSDPGLAATQP